MYWKLAIPLTVVFLLLAGHEFLTRRDQIQRNYAEIDGYGRAVGSLAEENARIRADLQTSAKALVRAYMWRGISDIDPRVLKYAGVTKEKFLADLHRQANVRAAVEQANLPAPVKPVPAPPKQRRYPFVDE